MSYLINVFGEWTDIYPSTGCLSDLRHSTCIVGRREQTGMETVLYFSKWLTWGRANWYHSWHWVYWRPIDAVRQNWGGSHAKHMYNCCCRHFLDTSTESTTRNHCSLSETMHLPQNTMDPLQKYHLLVWSFIFSVSSFSRSTSQNNIYTV